MRQLQNDQENIRSFYQNHRSNMPPGSAFTYGLINSDPGLLGSMHIGKATVDLSKLFTNPVSFVWTQGKPKPSDVVIFIGTRA